MSAKLYSSYCYGLHAVYAFLERNPQKIEKIYLDDSRSDHRIEKIYHLAEKSQIKLELSSKKMLDQLTNEACHQGVVAAYIPQPPLSEHELQDFLTTMDTPLLLVLDGVQDPHNLGACFRTADAAGVHAVIAPKDRAASLTASARKVACGAAETIPFVQVTNLARTLQDLQNYGIWCVGTDAQAPTTLYETELQGPLALILGSEEKGLRQLTRRYCDQLIAIPMAGIVTSLNVSVAAGVCLFEIARQRRNKIT